MTGPAAASGPAAAGASRPPDVSVVIPTCERPRLLLDTLASVVGQPDVTLEVIVVDDSAHGTAREAVESLGDARVRYVRRPEPSRGRPALARNDGARLAGGRYLYFLDDDDLLEAETLALMQKALDAAPTIGMAFGVVEPFGDDATRLRHEREYFREARRIARRLSGRRELSTRLAFLPSILVNSACMARRTAFMAAGGYDPEIPICEDAEMWGRLARAADYVFLDRPVVRYRTGAPSLMRSLAENDERLHVSYRRIQGRFREDHGVIRFLLAKLWARALLRFR